jgi:hypothetical protein
MLDDIAQWELLFRGEEVFWKSAGALREAGYTSVLALTQDAVNGSGSVPIRFQYENQRAEERSTFRCSSQRESKAQQKMIVQLSKHG